MRCCLSSEPLCSFTPPLSRARKQAGSSARGYARRQPVELLCRARPVVTRARGNASRRQPYTPTKGLAPSTLYDQVRASLRTAAESCARTCRGRGLAQASPHWLRHTKRAHAIAGGMPSGTVRIDLRSGLATDCRPGARIGISSQTSVIAELGKAEWPTSLRRPLCSIT